MQFTAGVPLTGASHRTLRVCDLPDVFAKRRRILATLVEGTVVSARSVAVTKWAAILQLDPAASQVGRQILAVQDSPDADALVQAIVSDVLAPKSTNTLAVRATAILLFIKWHRQSTVCDDVALPILEGGCMNI